MKPKMRVTICYQVEYEPDPDLYNTKDPEEMAAIDQKAAELEPFSALRGLLSELPCGKFKVIVKHVESQAERAGLELSE